MADVCIEFDKVIRYIGGVNPPDLYNTYKKWVKENYPVDAYYFPHNKRQIHFLDEADLIMFTLQFGKCYTIVPNKPDMTKIERMIRHESIVEQWENRINEKGVKCI